MVLCPEYSFIQFSDTFNDCCCERPLEVAEASELSFYVDYGDKVAITAPLVPGGFGIVSGVPTFINMLLYKRTPNSGPDIINLEEVYDYYYTGDVLIVDTVTQELYGVVYLDSLLNIIGYEAPVGFHENVLLTIPPNAKYLVGCSCYKEVLIEKALKNDLDLCDISGDTIHEIGKISEGWVTPDIDLSGYLACEDCFRFKARTGTGIYYSNVFIYNKKSNNPLIKYSSTSNSFFPFTEGKFNSVRLPIEIVNRNPNTETEEYVDANGRINNPYKTRRDVYKLNVDYSPVDFHKKIQVMLMHDVFIDGIEINETGDYEINYGESIRVNNRYLYMASTEVSEQDILMMRNY